LDKNSKKGGFGTQTKGEGILKTLGCWGHGQKIKGKTLINWTGSRKFVRKGEAPENM